MTPEGRLQQRAMKYAKEVGCKVKRNHMGPGVDTGWPDTEIFAPGGVVLLLEFKRPRGERRKKQIHHIQELTDLGHRAFFCDTLDDAKRHIDSAVSAGRSVA